MAYLTSFELGCFNCETADWLLDDGKYRTEIAELAGYDPDELWDEMVNWFSCCENMQEYSKRYPDMLFVIYGDGEYGDDIWVHYHKNGKVQQEEGKIVYPDFDESKLID